MAGVGGGEKAKKRRSILGRICATYTGKKAVRQKRTVLLK